MTQPFSLRSSDIFWICRYIFSISVMIAYLDKRKWMTIENSWLWTFALVYIKSLNEYAYGVSDDPNRL